MFQVGDAVRVKAGARYWGDPQLRNDGIAPERDWKGKQLKIRTVCNWTDNGYQGYNIDGRGVTENYLEPWNDAEEWDGAKWVAKKAETPPKPAVVLRSDGKGALRYPSTNSAVKEAKILSESNPGTEYVVYQEKASFKVEPKPSKAELLEESLLQERLRDITSQMHDCNDSHICDVKVVSLSRDENLVTVTYKVQP